MTSFISIKKFCILLMNNAVMGLWDRICLTSVQLDLILRLNHTYLRHFGCQKPVAIKQKYPLLSVIYRVILSLEDPNKFGKSIPEFEETHSSVLGCERRPVSASIMSRSYFASFPVCVYKFSSHYLNNVIFIDNILGPQATESPCTKQLRLGS